MMGYGEGTGVLLGVSGNWRVWSMCVGGFGVLISLLWTRFYYSLFLSFEFCNLEFTGN